MSLLSWLNRFLHHPEGIVLNQNNFDQTPAFNTTNLGCPRDCFLCSIMIENMIFPLLSDISSIGILVAKSQCFNAVAKACNYIHSCRSISEPKFPFFSFKYDVCLQFLFDLASILSSIAIDCSILSALLISGF